jgi:hypothetical protein
VVALTMDSPENPVVMQTDDDCAIPVELDSMFQWEMPGRTGLPRSLLLPAGGRAQFIVGDNPRRKGIVIWSRTQSLIELCCTLISDSEAECNAGQGALLLDGFSMSRYEFEYSGPLWARAVVLLDNGTGTSARIAPSTIDVVLGYVEEDWTK